MDNYGYDRLGQLIRDNSEGLMQIEWFSGNRKVKKITRSGKTIEFKYSPFGQRLLKTVTNTATGVVTTSYYVYDANGQVMGVYDLNLTTKNAKLNEQNIYGASRLGMIDRDIDLCINGTEQAAPVYPPAEPEIHTLGYKKYEIVNYLGNVNGVITDRKVYVGGTYEAVVIMNSDYYPFGMEMPGRHTNENKYRFGYNGMELDNEAKGNGNSYTTEFRQYDPRLGRWLSLDPMASKYPGMSPYVAFNDNPVYYVDPLGLEGEPIGEDDGSGNDEGFPGLPDGRNIPRGEDKGHKGKRNVIATGEKTPGQGRDMGSGYDSPKKISDDLTHGEGNRTLGSRFYYDDKALFTDLYALGNAFSDGDKAKKMVKGIIDHFKENTGKDYSSWDLTKAAADHPSTKRFIGDIKEAFEKEIKEEGAYRQDGSFNLKLEGHPRFSESGFLGAGSGDEDNGLKIAVNDVWDYDVKVITYKEVNCQYEAQVQLVLYDHFGLDKSDIVNHSYVAFYPEFYSWYVLQYGRGYKPFITVMHIPVFTIKGTLPK